MIHIIRSLGCGTWTRLAPYVLLEQSFPFSFIQKWIKYTLWSYSIIQLQVQLGGITRRISYKHVLLMQLCCPTSVHRQQPTVEFTLRLLQRATTTYLEGARCSAESNVSQPEPKEILSQFPECRYLPKTPNTQKVWYHSQKACLKVTEKLYQVAYFNYFTSVASELFLFLWQRST